MRHIQFNIETGLIINKATAVKMASIAFMRNKRATEVHIRSYNKLVVLAYRGSRTDLTALTASIEIVRVVPMDNREVS